MDSITYLSQKDELLIGQLGFTVDQLMELAGLSVATSVAEVYSSIQHHRILVTCGPGNNGGVGLVAARHLHHFGYKPFVCYPERTPDTPYTGFVIQVESLSIPFLLVEDLAQESLSDFDIIVDAIFGVSSNGKGKPRPPFEDLIHNLGSLHSQDRTCQKSPAIVSVDIPSGWNVDEGDIDGEGIKPDMLVSLIVPKLCAKKFCGLHHFLGCRFLPLPIADKHKIHLPSFPGSSTCVRLENPLSVDCKSPEFLESQVEADPIDQFRKWRNEAVAAGVQNPYDMVLSTADKHGSPSTNYESRKARELSENPRASLLFYWDALNRQMWRQVRVEGAVEKVSDEESDIHFHSRPRASQIAAIISNQSSILTRREGLHQEYKEVEARFSDGHLIPRPKHWGSYRLRPNFIEFWKGQQSRLHDRLQYSLKEVDGKQIWHIDWLAP